MQPFNATSAWQFLRVRNDAVSIRIVTGNPFVYAESSRTAVINSSRYTAPFSRPFALFRELRTRAFCRSSPMSPRGRECYCVRNATRDKYPRLNKAA